MEYIVYSLEHDDFLYRRYNRLVRFSWGKLGSSEEEELEVLMPMNEKNSSKEFMLFCELIGLQAELDSQDQTLKFAEGLSGDEYYKIPKSLEETIIVAVVDNHPDFDISYTYWELFEYGNRT